MAQLESQWYCIQGQAKRSVRNLRIHGYEAFCPMEKIRVGRSRRRRQIEKPIFGIYLFVLLDDPIKVWSLRGIPGIAKVVGLKPEGPDPADKEWVEAMIAHGPFLTSELVILARVPAHLGTKLIRRGRITEAAAEALCKLEPLPGLKMGQKVRAIGGPFSGKSGVFQELDKRGRAIILCRTLGRFTPVTIPVSQLAELPSPDGHSDRGNSASYRKVA